MNEGDYLDAVGNTTEKQLATNIAFTLHSRRFVPMGTAPVWVNSPLAEKTLRKNPN
jgi:hypothetical protein